MIGCSELPNTDKKNKRNLDLDFEIRNCKTPRPGAEWTLLFEKYFHEDDEG